MKVLVADDDEGSLLVAKAAVEKSGHECVTAADGDIAWQLYQSHQPQVVVTDLKMPGLDGIALCRAIRAAEKDSYTYLILLTSHTARDDVLAGMAAGVDDYVTKPLDPFTLHTRLLVALRVTSLHTELAGYRRALFEQARTDPLTGLRNRLALSEELELLHGRSERYGHDYCLAMCDVDNFKSYNDLYGHPAGDEVLKTIARTLVGQARQTDGIYRYGGEEFLLVLPDQTSSGAQSLLERTLAAVQALQLPHTGGAVGVVTLSAGLAAYTADHRVGTERLIQEADEALYAAKARGRNTLVIAAGPPRGSSPEVA